MVIISDALHRYQIFLGEFPVEFSFRFTCVVKQRKKDMQENRAKITYNLLCNLLCNYALFTCS